MRAQPGTPIKPLACVSSFLNTAQLPEFLGKGIWTKLMIEMLDRVSGRPSM